MISTLNSSSAVLHYLIHDEVPHKFGIIAFFIGAVAGMIGRVIALYITYKYNRASIVIYAQILAAIIAFGANSYYLCVQPFELQFRHMCA